MNWEIICVWVALIAFSLLAWLAAWGVWSFVWVALVKPLLGVLGGL